MAVQLSFAECGQDFTFLEDVLAKLVVSSASRTKARLHAQEAARITASRFSDWAERPLDVQERSRIQAYYSAVLRRRILRSHDGEAQQARTRLIARSIEQDLLKAGWNQSRAAEEARMAVGMAVGL